MAGKNQLLSWIDKTADLPYSLYSTVRLVRAKSALEISHQTLILLRSKADEAKTAFCLHYDVHLYTTFQLISLPSGLQSKSNC